MILDNTLRKLGEVNNISRKIREDLKYNIERWLSINGLFEEYYINKLNGYHIVLEAFDLKLTDEQINDFEYLFNTKLESIHKCEISNVKDITDNYDECDKDYVKYSYFFVDATNIF